MKENIVATDKESAVTANHRFDGKVALVTGGASGIGRTTSLAFAVGGAKVAVCDLDQDGAARVVQEISDAGGTAMAVGVDVRDAASVEAMVARVTGEYDGLHCAFNNAGVSEGYGPDDRWSDEVFDRTMAINARGVYLCLKHEIDWMLAHGGGTIVNTASIAGLGANSTLTYVASKHAVVGMTRAAAIDHATQGIRVNCVCPGAINTPMVGRSMAAGFRELIEGLHPIGRIGEPQEIADAVLWLCSPQSSFVTGHALPVDGGVMAK